MTPLDSKPDPRVEKTADSDSASPDSPRVAPPPTPPSLPGGASPDRTPSPGPSLKEAKGLLGNGRTAKTDKEKDRDADRSLKEQTRKKKKKKKRKEQEKAEIRRAEPWQRYKAMIDSLKEAQDLVDLADHKARFALLIMGALNAAIIILGTQSDLLARVPSDLRGWLYGYLAVYAVIAIYFLVQAIESLRPRSLPDLAQKRSISEKEESLGLRFYVDAVRYDMPMYLTAWQTVRVSQLNAEVATQLHNLAHINRAKYEAVARLYRGLQAIVLLTAGLMMALASAAWITHQTIPSFVVAAGGLRTASGDWAILGEPEGFPVPGVKEPSGIAFAMNRGTFFVVGDEGSLVEVSKDAEVKSRIPIPGNLEDVAVHAPSGRLVLLSERKGQLIVFDPTTGSETGRFQLDDVALLGEAGVDPNQGFEGLAFRPEKGRPGDGVFYLVHQRAPALLVEIAFDPLAPSGTIGAAALVGRAPVGQRQDLTAVTYDAILDRLFVIADSKDRLVMLTLSGKEEAEIILPGRQQEGVAFDPEGNLWVADDRAGLLVFRGARDKIAAEIRGASPVPAVTRGGS